MNIPTDRTYYTFSPPADEDLEPTLDACQEWVDKLMAGLGRDGEFWVFAYGSLIWHPDFPVAEQMMAQAFGYHRSFCVYSFHYRGTREQPGLVLGLDRGGSCHGVAMRVARRDTLDVARYLWRREMVSHAYVPRELTIDAGPLETVQCSGSKKRRRVKAHCFVADQTHEQYAGRLGFDETVQLLRQGVGNRGTNIDYLNATVSQLEGLGIVDAKLRRLTAAVAGTDT